MLRHVVRQAASALALFALAGAADAKPARCFTTDDGTYPCEFRATDRQGSFTISARGKPTFSLEVSEPGVAFGFADFGTGRNVALPGRYLRSSEDGACWRNDATSAELCAW